MEFGRLRGTGGIYFRDSTNYWLLFLYLGIKFHYVAGDNATMGVVPIAHKAALECDIVYGTRYYVYNIQKYNCFIVWSVRIAALYHEKMIYWNKP